MNSPEKPSWHSPAINHETETDNYGIPVDAFGADVPPDFFELIGRILAVHGKIEYLQGRLSSLPSAEKDGVKKVEQFLVRCAAEKANRNTLVHSYWIFGSHTEDPDVILALRYKTRKKTSGEVATVSIVDVPEGVHEQDLGQYTLDDLRRIMRRSTVTMRIGERAYSEIMLKWSSVQTSSLRRVADFS